MINAGLKVAIRIITFLMMTSLLLPIQSATAAISFSGSVNTQISPNGGGGLTQRDCSDVSSNILTGVSAELDVDFLTQMAGRCDSTSDGTTRSGSTVELAQTLAPSYWGTANPSGSPSTIDCPANKVVVGATVYEGPTKFVQGLKLKCGDLPSGNNTEFTATIGLVSANAVDLQCATSTIAIGLSIYSGSIVDRFGIRCQKLIVGSHTFSGAASDTVVFGANSNSYNVPTSINAGNGDGSLTYSETSANCSVDSSSGVITITGAGVCEVTVGTSGSVNYTDTATTTFTLTVSQAPTTTTVSCTSPVIYTGSALTPCTATVTGAGGLALTATPTYLSNTNAGTASASYDYAGDENYLSSSDSKDFTIDKAPTTTTVSCTSPVIYTGSALTPCTATVTGAGGLALTATPTYLSNTNAGTASASYDYSESNNHLASTNAETFTISAATGLVAYTGTNTVPEGSRINLTALSTFASACAGLSLYKYQYFDDLSDTWEDFAPEGSIIQKPIITLDPGVYHVRVVYNGSSEPDPNCGAYTGGTVVLTVYAAGSNAYGGGFYTIPGEGKANFGFVVQKVAKTTNTFKGQVLWNFKENWRFKGTLNNFGKNLDGSIGSSSGTGILQEWDETALEGIGDWVTAESDVNVILKFTATTASGKKSSGNPGSFSINFSYLDPTLPVVNTLINLKGGNIKYS